MRSLRMSTDTNRREKLLSKTKFRNILRFGGCGQDEEIAEETDIGEPKR